MKKVSLGFSLAALAALAPTALHAQAGSVVYGQTRFTFTPALLQVFSSVGASVTDLSLRPLPDGTAILPITQGVLDAQTLAGEAVFSGGYQVTGAGSTLRVQDLALDITSPTVGTVSGIFVVNGKVLGRQAIFAITGSLAQTVTAQGPIINVNGLTIGLTPTFVSVINNAFGPGTFTAGTTVGTVSGYAVLVPLTTPLN